MKKIQVKTLDDLDIVLNVSRDLFDKKGECEVIVKNIDESITDAQRGLYWVWCGVIGADLGNTKDEQHQYFKERYLLNIYINDPVNHPEFIGVVDNMQVIKANCPEQYAATRALIISGVSTTAAKKLNMIDLLDEVDGMARSLNIRLPAPPRDGLM